MDQLFLLLLLYNVYPRYCMYFPEDFVLCLIFGVSILISQEGLVRFQLNLVDCYPVAQEWSYSLQKNFSTLWDRGTFLCFLHQLAKQKSETRTAHLCVNLFILLHIDPMILSTKLSMIFLTTITYFDTFCSLGRGSARSKCLVVCVIVSGLRSKKKKRSTSKWAFFLFQLSLCHMSFLQSSCQITALDKWSTYRAIKLWKVFTQ